MRQPICFAILVSPLLAACGGEGSSTEPSAAASVTARAAAPTPVVPRDLPGGVPQITWAATTRDFGVISDTQTYETSFSFTNTGTGKLVISNVKPGCGCTTPTLDRNEFMPGETATIDVVFDPSKKSGMQNKPITVTSNARNSPVSRLSIMVEIRPLARPETLILQLGILPLGQEHKHTINVHYTDPQLRVTGLDLPNPHVSARLVKTGIRDPQTGEYRATIEITVARDAPWGMLTDATLDVGVRGVPVQGSGPVEKVYPVFISARIFGDLRPQPAVFKPNGSISPGQPYELSTVLYRTSGTPFAITSAAVKDVPEAAVRFEPLSRSSYRVTLAGTAPVGPRALRGSVTVHTDVAGEEKLTLPVSASIR